MAGAVLSLCAATAPVSATPPASPIAWGACSDPVLAQAGAQCGTLTVPVDRRNPSGQTFTLALSRIRHTSPDSAYQGVLLTVPNPLGGSGLQLPLIASRLPGDVSATYDWIGFARRGLVPSQPALTCVPDYFTFDRPHYVPTTPQILQQWQTKTQGYADGCFNSNGQAALLPHMKTTDTTADMESIRAALGVDQLTLYGQSYGTYIGQVYSTQYPTRVRRMVLDSNVDPRRVWYNAAAFDQNVPLQRNLFVWFDWLASHNDAYNLGTSRAALTQVWDQQLAQVDTAPADGVIGPDEWIDLFLFPSYSRQTWTLFGSAFSNWVHQGDGATLRFLFDQFYHQPNNENTYAALMAQVCTDAPWPKDWSRWQADSDASHAQAPYTTWGNTWFNAPCLYWRVPAAAPVQINGGLVRSALLIGETLDAATPFEGSLEVRSRYPYSALIGVADGTDNGSTPNGNACVDNAIAAYLATGALPARKPGRRVDLLCPAPQLPTPQ